MRWVVVVLLFGLLMPFLMAQEGEKEKPKGPGGAMILQKIGGISVTVSDDGRILVNGKEVGRVRKNEPVTITVIDGKVFINGKQVKVRREKPRPRVIVSPLKKGVKPLPPREKERWMPHPPDFRKLLELLKEHLGELPDELKGALKEWERWSKSLREGAQRWRRWDEKGDWEKMQEEAKERWGRFSEEWRKRAEDLRKRWGKIPESGRERWRGRIEPELGKIFGELKRMAGEVDRRLQQLKKLMEETEEGAEKRWAPVPSKSPKELQKMVEQFVDRLIERVRKVAGEELEKGGQELVERLLERLTDEQIDRILDGLQRLLESEEGARFREKMMERMLDRLLRDFFPKRKREQKHRDKEKGEF